MDATVMRRPATYIRRICCPHLAASAEVFWVDLKMAAATFPSLASRFLQLILVAFTLLLLIPCSAASEQTSAAADCHDGPGECHNRTEALRLKLIAIASILGASMIGVCLPLFSRALPALRPDRDLFSIIKAFASGVILGTGFMHVLPDSFDDLRSPCLPEKPWHVFPFSSFVAMVSAVITLMLDSFAMTFYNRRRQGKISVSENGSTRTVSEMLHEVHGHGHGHGHGHAHVHHLDGEPPAAGKDDDEAGAVLRRNRVIAQVLELGIVVHSVVIGLSMGASDSPCTIRPLVAAICFHQLFEGMGLGGCILQAEYGMKMKAVLVFFFSTTTPFGIALGIAISNVYSDSSPTSLIVIGILNASSAGLLIYMALVDLLAADFLGPKLQGSASLQLKAYAAVLLGLGGMSLMAKWA